MSIVSSEESWSEPSPVSGFIRPHGSAVLDSSSLGTTHHLLGINSTSIQPLYHPEPPMKLSRFESWGPQDDGACWIRRESTATAILYSLKSAPPSLGSMLVATHKTKTTKKTTPVNNKKKKTAMAKAPKDVAIVAKKQKPTKVKTTKRQNKSAAPRVKDPVVVPARQRCFPRQAKAPLDKTLLPSPMHSQPNKPMKATGRISPTTKPSQQVACSKPADSCVPKNRTTVTSFNSRRHSINTSAYTILEMTDKDVLSGRGNGIAMLPGNCAFRKLVAAHRHAYAKSVRHEKCAIAQVIMDAVHEQGGRFLEQSDACEKYRIMEHGRVLEKTSQALRERCASKR